MSGIVGMIWTAPGETRCGLHRCEFIASAGEVLADLGGGAYLVSSHHHPSVAEQSLYGDKAACRWVAGPGRMGRWRFWTPSEAAELVQPQPEAGCPLPENHDAENNPIKAALLDLADRLARAEWEGRQ